MYQTNASIASRFIAMCIDSILINVIIGFLAFYSMPSYALSCCAAVVLYYGLLEGSNKSASVGKMVMGLMVVDVNGNPLNMSQSFIRAFGRCLSAAIFGIGYLMACFNESGQTTHDMIANTHVINARGQVQGQRANPSGNFAGAQPKIIGLSGPFVGKSYPVLPQGSMLGRDAASCDLVFPINAQDISRNHCKVQFTPETNLFIISDLGSSYGTFDASGARIPQGKSIALQSNQEFYLSNGAYRFKVST